MTLNSKTLKGTVVEWTSQGSLQRDDMDPAWRFLEFVTHDAKISGDPRDAGKKEGLYEVQPGDFLRIFNDASRKDVLWEGKFDGQYGRYGSQKNIDENFWRNLVSKKREAELTPKPVATKKPQTKKDHGASKTETVTVTLNGVLYRMNDQGANCPRAFQDERFITNNGKKWSYDGHHRVENGDLLTIFNDTARKDTLWSGVVDMKNNTQTGFDKKSWDNFFRTERPATLVKKIPKKS